MRINGEESIICRACGMFKKQNVFADISSTNKLISVLKEKGKGLENGHSPESHNGSKYPQRGPP